jgi:murein DD-endopeptidase MepM/ murein hydrolase activator NlpD
VQTFSLLLTLFLIAGCVTPLPTDLTGKVTVVPKSVHQGETVLIQFQLQSSQKVLTQSKGVNLEVGDATQKNESDAKVVHHPRVFNCPAGFCALVGVGLDYPVGNLHIALKLPDGSTLDSTTISVHASEKPMERLRVDPSRVKLSTEDQRRVDEEREIVHGALNTARAEDLESFAFALPIRSKETSAFGKKRVFNGEPRGYHTGVDLRAGVGSKIRSANSGIVRLARPLFMAGNHVLVDHGGGIFSSYSHLSEISVKEGQRIARGDLVGKAGATGRVTAPHLHWTVRVAGEAVDPMQFMDLLRGLSNQESSELTKAVELPAGVN